MGWNGIRNVSKKWEGWKNYLIGLEKIELKKYIKPRDFGKIVHISLHSFSDASGLGYEESSYLMLIDKHGHMHCTLMMNKERKTHRRSVSIPRLELVAAGLAIKISA